MARTRQQQQKHSRSDEEKEAASVEPTLPPKAKQAKRVGRPKAKKEAELAAAKEGRDETAQGASAKREGCESDEETSDDDELEINRSPVLTLWVAVVAERLGFSTDEAYTYGRWVASSLAATRDRKVESVQPVDDKGSDVKGEREQHEIDERHVNVFAQMKIPVKQVDGKRFAYMVRKNKMIQPETVRSYFERKFGDKFDETHKAMIELAQSMEADEVRNQAYELFSQFKPDTNERGQVGTMDLDKIRKMAAHGVKGA